MRRCAPREHRCVCNVVVGVGAAVATAVVVGGGATIAAIDPVVGAAVAVAIAGGAPAVVVAAVVVPAAVVKVAFRCISIQEGLEVVSIDGFQAFFQGRHCDIQGMQVAVTLEKPHKYPKHCYLGDEY